MERKLDVVVDSLATYVHPEQRPDGRWQARLEFRSRTESFWTDVQTTQSSEQAVIDWARGLTVTHIQNACRHARTHREPRPAVVTASPTPAHPADRLAHLRSIERDVISLFASLGKTALRTSEFFARGPHANSDFIRAFEDLEKRWRYVARRTLHGNDILELTPEGAEAAGLPSEAGTSARLERPKPIA